VGGRHALGREPIDLGRRNRGAAEGADIPVAEIVGEEHDDVGPVVGRARRGSGRPRGRLRLGLAWQADGEQGDEGEQRTSN
jgi:hypothetical protein